MSNDPAVHNDLRRDLQQWFARTPGKLMLELELERISQRLPEMFGYHLIQIGQLSGVDMTEGSLIRDRTIIDIGDAGFDSTYASIRGDADALPVASDSVDVVILPHVLEFERRPHETLREVQRVLVPEGSVLISGFNPWSMMGVWRRVLRHRGTSPWCGQFLGLNRVSDWLALLGFDVTAVDSFFFRPPLRSDRVMEKLGAAERLGPRTGGVMAGLYLISARKRFSTLTPIRPTWSARRRLVSVGLANNSARTASSTQRRQATHLSLVPVEDSNGRSRR